ncbi:MAG: hypothetical protein Q9168_002714 [Polycauliona sp. 1 TL-2023]
MAASGMPSPSIQQAPFTYVSITSLAVASDSGIPNTIRDFGDDGSTDHVAKDDKRIIFDIDKMHEFSMSLESQMTYLASLSKFMAASGYDTMCQEMEKPSSKAQR